MSTPVAHKFSEGSDRVPGMLRLWEGLDFTKAGRIPRAGRLRKADGSGEEYVDAWVFYKKFDTPSS